MALVRFASVLLAFVGIFVCPRWPADTVEAAVSPPQVDGMLLFFWGVGCPHCEDARPFVTKLPAEYPKLRVEAVEVRRNASGRRRFLDKMRELGISNPGLPTFVYGRRYEIGFVAGVTEARVRRMLEANDDVRWAASASWRRGPTQDSRGGALATSCVTRLLHRSTSSSHKERYDHVRLCTVLG